MLGDGLLSRLAGLVKGRSAEAPPPPQSPQSEKPAPAEDPFQVTLQQVLLEENGRFNTKLHIISLVEFREAIGEKWGKVAEKVMLIAEGVIQLHLGAGNVCGRQGQDFFILLFRTCDGLESRHRALAIAKELGTRLVGDKVLGADRPLALAAEISLDDAAHADGSLNLWAIQQSIEEMRSILASQAGEGSEESRLRSWMKQTLTDEPEHGLRYHMVPSEGLPPPPPEPARASMLPSQPPPQAKPAAPPSWSKPPVAISGLIENAAAMDCPEWREFDVHSMPAHDGLLHAGLPLPPEVRLSQLWRPTWVADGEVIGTYRAHIQRKDAPAATLLEGAQAYNAGAETAQSLDRFAIGQAMRSFLAAETAGLGSTIVLPIHWASLQAEKRTELLAPLADATQQARAARLVIEIFGIPSTVDADTLTGCIRVVKPLCRDVVVRTSLSQPHAILAAQCGAALLALDLSDLTNAERVDDDKLLRRLLDIMDQARGSGLGACLWGARRRKVVTGAILGGFSMVNGPALMKDLAKPAKIVPAPKAKFGG